MSLAEVVVSMVILMVVLTMISRVMLDGAATKDSISGDAAVSIAADQATDQLVSDVRAAESPLRRNASEAGIVAGSEGGVDIRDIVLASPYAMQLRADTDSRAAGVECVHYQVDSQGSLWRSVRSNFVTCAAAPTDSARRIMPGLGARDPDVTPIRTAGFDMTYVAGADRPPAAASFEYQVAVPDGTGACTKQPMSVVVGDAMSRILGVTVTIAPVVMKGSDVSTRSYTETISLRSRSTASYRRAIGCAGGVS